MLLDPFQEESLIVQPRIKNLELSVHNLMKKKKKSATLRLEADIPEDRLTHAEVMYDVSSLNKKKKKFRSWLVFFYAR